MTVTEIGRGLPLNAVGVPHQSPGFAPHAVPTTNAVPAGGANPGLSPPRTPLYPERVPHGPSRVRVERFQRSGVHCGAIPRVRPAGAAWRQFPARVRGATLGFGV